MVIMVDWLQLCTSVMSESRGVCCRRGSEVAC